MELPYKAESEPSKLMDSMELWVGRVAMIGATGIFVKEVFTGESILDQCQTALQQCVSHL
jgi:Leu/Phe-tRNA-protein transferase